MWGQNTCVTGAGESQAHRNSDAGHVSDELRIHGVNHEMTVSYYSVLLVPCVPFLCTSIGSMFLVPIC
jgi:hypothetical protein